MEQRQMTSEFRRLEQIFRKVVTLTPNKIKICLRVILEDPIFPDDSSLLV